MAAKKKSAKKAAKKPAASSKKKGGKADKKEPAGKRGRKKVLVGDITPDQGKRMRRALRARDIKLSDLPEGQTIDVTIKGDKMTCKVGKDTIELNA